MSLKKSLSQDAEQEVEQIRKQLEAFSHLEEQVREYISVNEHILDPDTISVVQFHLRAADEYLTLSKKSRAWQHIFLELAEAPGNPLGKILYGNDGSVQTQKPSFKSTKPTQPSSLEIPQRKTTTTTKTSGNASSRVSRKRSKSVSAVGQKQTSNTPSSPKPPPSPRTPRRDEPPKSPNMVRVRSVDSDSGSSSKPIHRLRRRSSSFGSQRSNESLERLPSISEADEHRLVRRSSDSSLVDSPVKHAGLRVSKSKPSGLRHSKSSSNYDRLRPSKSADLHTTMTSSSSSSGNTKKTKRRKSARRKSASTKRKKSTTNTKKKRLKLKSVLQGLSTDTNFSLPELQKLLKRFRQHTNGWKVTLDQFSQILEAWGVSDHLISERIFAAFDSRNEGLVNFKTFVTQLSSLHQEDPETMVRFFTLLYDIDGDGVISRSELYRILMSAMGPSIQYEDLIHTVQTVFTKLDANNDGVISYEEFAQNIDLVPELLDKIMWILSPDSLLLESDEEEEFVEQTKVLETSITVDEDDDDLFEAVSPDEEMWNSGLEPLESTRSRSRADSFHSTGSSASNDRQFVIEEWLQEVENDPQHHGSSDFEFHDIDNNVGVVHGKNVHSLINTVTSTAADGVTLTVGKNPNTFNDEMGIVEFDLEKWNEQTAGEWLAKHLKI